MQRSLFESQPSVYVMEECRIEHYPAFFDSLMSDRWMASLKEELSWRQDTITLFGKTHLIPRLNAWYGDVGTDFAYSGIPLEALEWTETIGEIRKALEQRCSVKLNSVLANWYRTGLDKMGWHSDDEKQMCPVSPIVSLSFGASRKMQFKSKIKSNSERLCILLEHGDVLVMYPPTQEKLKHCIPMMRKVTTDRLNLTFRHCLNSQSFL